MGINYKVLDSISNVLESDNYTRLSEKEFYHNILTNLSREINFLFGGVYFLDDTTFVQKAFLNFKNTSAVNTELFDFNETDNILNFINSKEKKTFYAQHSDIADFFVKNFSTKNIHFLFSKLGIKKSLFGFLFLMRKTPFSNDEIATVNAYLGAYSYIIKDYELNNVYKTQLSILQEAITDKETALRTIEKQNKKLIQADSVKTSFLANVSHELRTPLNAIIGFSEVLANQIVGKLNKKQLEYVKDINLSSVHLLGLINSLLDFSKIESGSMKLNLSEFDTHIAVQEVINILKPLLNAKEIEIKYDNTCVGNIKADYQKFQQILFNLIGNAIKFSAQKSNILVRTYFEGEYFILEVEDFGIGIDKKYHNFIFKKFTQIDNIYTKTNTSTGLGLAITKEYVRLHKGKIFVVSTPGLGSTFVVKLKQKKVIKNRG